MRDIGEGRTTGEPPLRVYAAGSLRSAFDALALHWPGVADIRYANAGVLAEAIVAGEPADVFASASPHEPERLAALGIAEPGLPFASNRLVLAVPLESEIDEVEALAEPGTRIVIEIAGVPLGDYTREVLDGLCALYGRDFASGVLENVVCQRDSVDAVSAAVYDGEADAAILYATDVHRSEGRLRAIELPREAAVPATYVLCALRGAARRGDAGVWIDLTLGPLGQRILRAAGFRPPW